MADLFRFRRNLAVLLALITSMHIANAGADDILDPIQSIIDKGGVGRDESLLVVKLDWNEDGQEDYFLLPKSFASFNGGVTWTVYVSNGRGAFTIAESGLEGPFGDFRIKRLDEVNGKLAIIRFARVGPEGARIDALYLKDNRQIAVKSLAFISNPERQPNATEQGIRKAEVENQAAFQRYIDSSTVVQTQEVVVSGYRSPSARNR
jgi:hypothetical protein